MKARVLVVDDEPAIRESVAYALEREGFDVEAVADGESALETARTVPLDAIVLDIMLPDVPGTEVCRRLRGVSAVPIVLLTAKDTEVDRVVGLELGADDYVTKPFSLVELIARVRAVLRRRELDRAEAGAPLLRVDGLEIDRLRHEVRVDGREVDLTPSEFRLLSMLASAPGRAFTRRELVQELWRSDFVGDERICDTHIVGLRRKVETDPARPARILSVRGVGYKLAER
jgi:two-component system response regulator RegX3